MGKNAETDDDQNVNYSLTYLNDGKQSLIVGSISADVRNHGTITQKWEGHCSRSNVKLR